MAAPILVRHLIDVLSVVVLLICCFGCGDWLLSRMPGKPRELERLLFGITIGAGLISTIILALSAVGLLHSAVLWSAVLVPGLAAYRQLRDLPQLTIHAVANVRGTDAVATVIARLVLTGLVALLLIGALSPTVDWDSLMYHLEVPRQILQVGRLHIPEDNLHAALVGVVHMLYLPLLSVKGSAGPALLNAAFALMVGLAVLSAGTRFFNRTTGIVSFVVLWGSAPILLGAVTPRVDVTLALFLFLCHYALLAALEREGSWGFTAAGLLAGIAIGTKVLALIYLTSLVPVAVWVAVVRFGNDVKRVLRPLSIAFALSLLAAFPWILKNVMLLGPTLYPAFGEPIQPSWITALVGTDHLQSVPPAVHGVLGHARDPVTFGALLFSPGRLTVESELRWAVTNPVFFLLPLSLILLRVRILWMFLVAPVAYLLLLLVPREFINLRYLIPAYPALTIGAVESIRRVGSKVFGEKRTARLLQAGCVLTLVPTMINARYQVATPPAVAVATGRTSEEGYLAAVRPHYFKATRWINEYTSPHDRILFLFEGRAYYFDRDIVQDNVMTNWPLLRAAPAYDRCLQGSGITHILVNEQSAAYLRRRGADLDQLGWQHFPDFADECLERVHAELGFSLFRVREPDVTR